jgi:hypothetical protein
LRALLPILLVGLFGSSVHADPLTLHVRDVAYLVDPATLRVDAMLPSGASVPVLPPSHTPEAVEPSLADGAWHWKDGRGRMITVSVTIDSLRLTIVGAPDSRFSLDLPNAVSGTWLVPDGEGMAYRVDDPFWRSAYRREQCLGGTSLLSFPAWSYLSESESVTYALGDGLHSQLCLRDSDGLQARLRHEFEEGAETLELFLAIGPADPLAPALFYRRVLLQNGALVTFADKAVKDLPRLFGAPHAYVWGDGRDVGFLDDLKAIGIERMVLSYDQDPRTHHHLVDRGYLAKAYLQGYLAGPYEAFDNGQPKEMADSPVSVWPDDLYPSGCVVDAKGERVTGFAGRGCYMSSEAIARYPGTFVPAARYAGHVAAGASQIFLDVDAFGNFFRDYSPQHQMTMARDRENRLSRMALAIKDYGLVLGSENVTAWSSGVTHYSHGSAQAYVSAVWPLLNQRQRFGTWWPSDRPSLFFALFTPTPDEARALFGPEDRLPLFEAVFHDSVVTLDRWEFGLMKVSGQERSRYARALLYGVPTMWNLDRRELTRVGPWLKAAQDDFHAIHGWGVPVPLTGFRWLSPDRLVQETTYADGRSVIANFAGASWNGLDPECVRLIRADQSQADFCPPEDPGSPAAKL